MHRFYMPPETIRGATLQLPPAEAHHAIHVVRLMKGEEVVVLDGIGNEYFCTITDIAKKTVQVTVARKHFVAPLPYEITLLQAIPKGKLIETIIQKATELGVARVVPLMTERVATRLEGDEIEDKREKWQHVAVEAIKQCGQPWLPKIDAPVSLKIFLSHTEQFDLPLVGALRPGSAHPREFFKAYQERQKKTPQSLAIWIGPEGDFSPAEMDAILQSGALPITLGRLVLRCDTAALYCMSVLNYEMQAQYVERNDSSFLGNCLI